MNPNKPFNFFRNFPRDILGEILAFLDAESISKAYTVCRLFCREIRKFLDRILPCRPLIDIGRPRICRYIKWKATTRTIRLPQVINYFTPLSILRRCIREGDLASFDYFFPLLNKERFNENRDTIPLLLDEVLRNNNIPKPTRLELMQRIYDKADKRKHQRNTFHELLGPLATGYGCYDLLVEFCTSIAMRKEPPGPLLITWSPHPGHINRIIYGMVKAGTTTPWDVITKLVAKFEAGEVKQEDLVGSNEDLLRILIIAMVFDREDVFADLLPRVEEATDYSLDKYTLLFRLTRLSPSYTSKWSRRLVSKIEAIKLKIK
jgi:hypothetical protein